MILIFLESRCVYYNNSMNKHFKIQVKKAILELFPFIDNCTARCRLEICSLQFLTLESPSTDHNAAHNVSS